MALRTLGTNGTASLSAVMFNHSQDVMTDSDMAAANALIRSDSGMSGQQPPFFAREGQLWIPRRGWVKILAGDYIAVDSTGWPILLSKNAVASGPYTHT